MRSWRKSLGMLAGGLASLGGLVSSAGAQYPPPGGGMMPGMPPGMMMGGGGPPPGAFGGNPDLGGQPADFPNAAVPSKEPAAPFSIKDEGMPNAFTELIDPRPRVAQPYTVVFRSEYIGWWISKAGTTVPLVTTNSNFLNGENGGIGQPNTQVLVPAGNNTIDYNRLNGARATLGLALGFAPPVEVSGFSFNRNLPIFNGGTVNATGILISRPVQLTNANSGPNTPLETAEVINIPGVLNGNISIVSRLSLWGVDANMLFNVMDARNLKVDLLVGYRHVDLYEALDITTHSGGFSGQVIFNGAFQPPGFASTIMDSFRTRNAFDGGQMGVRSVLTFDRLSLFTDLKLALGNTYHSLSIDGSTTLTEAASNRTISTLPGGLLALPSNSGISTKNHFSIVPETSFSLSYQLFDHIRLMGGYNVIYWNSVARPGDHLNSVIDARGVPSAGIFRPGAGTAPTMPPLVLRDFWAQGFNVGVEFAF